MRGKKGLAVMMTVAMILSICSCAAPDSRKSDKKEALETATVANETEKIQESTGESTEEEVNDLFLTDSDMEIIYDSIETNLKKDYLDVNNIKIEDFEIPTDDKSWEYFARYCIEKPYSDNPSEEDFQKGLMDYYGISEENFSIMRIIAATFYDYLVEIDDVTFITSYMMTNDSSIDTAKELIISNVFANPSETE